MWCQKIFRFDRPPDFVWIDLSENQRRRCFAANRENRREFRIERERERESKCGLPLGNLTSQLFANIYLNELDQSIKHRLKIRYYLRYCDDFVIPSGDRDYLLNLIEPIELFLKNNLKLSLHQNKIAICKLRQGIDFLGYVTLPRYRVLCTKTKKRMLAKINRKNLPSYLGLLKYCKSRKLANLVRGRIIV